MKKLITFVFLFSFFAAGVLNFQAIAQTANQGATQSSATGGQTSTAGGQAPTMGGQAQGQASNGSYAGVSQTGMNALGGRKSSDLSAAEWNAFSESDRKAILAEERIQDVMKQEEVSREEAQKLIGAHDQTVAENIEKNKQAIACSKGDSNFSKYLVSYVGSGSSYCWFCSIFEGLFDAMNNLATAISVKMADIFLMIMGVGLLFSIAFKVAKMVVSMQGADLMQFLTDMFKHLGRAIIATALLVSSLSIFTYLVSPVLTMSMGVSAVIMDEGGGRGALITATQSTGIKAGSICDDLADQMKVSTSVEDQKKAFTPEVKASFICALRTMSAGLIFGIVLGVCIYGLAFSNMIAGIIPNFQYAVLGVIIVLGHLAILVTFPFKLIDSMIRMAFVTALMPLWIILWVFPATVGYTKKAWDLFLSSCLIFVCLSVVITLVMNIMQYAIPNREEIIGLLLCGFDKEAAARIPIGGKELLVTAALTFLGWKMLGTATTLASSFVGAIPDLGVGNSIHETTIKGGKFVGKLGYTGGRKAANSKTGQLVQRKTGLDSRRAAKLGTLAATGVATAGAAPLLYGAYRAAKPGVLAGYRAVRNKFMGGGDGAVQENNKAPNTPPQGNEKVPNVPPQGNEKAPNILPQGNEKLPNIPLQGNKKVPNVPLQGNIPNPPMPTPNIPSPKGKTTPATSRSSGSGTSSEAMSFSMGDQSAGGMSVTSGTSSMGTGKSTETMSFNAAASAGGTPTSTLFDAAPSQEPLNEHENVDRADSSWNATNNRQDNATDQAARDAARQAAADAQRAAAQAAAAQAAATQALSEASKKDKDDDKKE